MTGNKDVRAGSHGCYSGHTINSATSLRAFNFKIVTSSRDFPAIRNC